MINKVDLEIHIKNLLVELDRLQNSDGSFDTFFFFPSFPKELKWRLWNKKNNPPIDTATILIILLNLNTSITKKVFAKGSEFLLKSSFKRKFWKYSNNLSFKIIMPFDMDSTVQCSYVLLKKGLRFNNITDINCSLNKEMNYKAYPIFYNNLFFYLQNRKSTIFKKSNQMALIDDWETGITCNVLLYLGKLEENRHVWSKLKEDFENMEIETNYYSFYYSVYAYARLICYGNHADMKPSNEKLNVIINKLYEQLEYENESLDFLFLANTILFFNLDIHIYSKLIKYVFKKIEEKKQTDIAIYYSGNSKISTPETNAYFGSPAMTCSLYLEFLNLYRKKVYGTYFSDKEE